MPSGAHDLHTGVRNLLPAFLLGLGFSICTLRWLMELLLVP